MFIGVFPPALEVEDLPLEMPSLMLLNMFYVSNEIDEFEAKLYISIENGVEQHDDIFPKIASKIFTKPSDFVDEDEWLVITPFDLSGIMIDAGTRIISKLECPDVEQRIVLRVDSIT